MEIGTERGREGGREGGRDREREREREREVSEAADVISGLQNSRMPPRGRVEE